MFNFRMLVTYVLIDPESKNSKWKSIKGVPEAGYITVADKTGKIIFGINESSRMLHNQKIVNVKIIFIKAESKSSIETSKFI